MSDDARCCVFFLFKERPSARDAELGGLKRCCVERAKNSKKVNFPHLEPRFFKEGRKTGPVFSLFSLSLSRALFPLESLRSRPESDVPVSVCVGENSRKKEMLFDGGGREGRRVERERGSFFDFFLFFLPSFPLFCSFISARPCLLVDTGAAPHKFHARERRKKRGRRERREGESCALGGAVSEIPRLSLPPPLFFSLTATWGPPRNWRKTPWISNSSRFF